MKFEDIPEFYRGSLPHFQNIGATFFVTFRLHDSIPVAKLQQTKAAFSERQRLLRRQRPPDLEQQMDRLHREFFGIYDNLLEKIRTGPHYLEQPAVAQEVMRQLHRYDGDLYDLIGYTIMSNHVHLLIDTALQVPEDIHPVNWEGYDFTPLNRIMHRIKGASARYCNLILGRTGTFWQRESYDRIPRRNGELGRIIGYILNNPVKAGLVDNWRKHPFTYYCMSE